MTIVANQSTIALDVEVVVGATAVQDLGPRISALAAAIPGLPVTSTWPWLAASLSVTSPHETPWAVTLSTADDIVAAAVLLDDTSSTRRRTTLAGTAEEHRGALLAVDAAAGAHLGAALADALMATPREFALGPMPSGPAVSTLLTCLPIGLVLDAVEVPMVVADPDMAVGMSHGVSRTLRKAANRMSRDGLTPVIEVTSDGAAISALLPLLAGVSRDRDLACGRESPLDDPIRRRLWQRRVRNLAARGAMRFATLRLNGELAAYVLGIDDGSTYRVLEGRYVARWARYAPGRVLEAAVLSEVVDGEQYSVFDWMTAVAPESLLAANGVDPMIVLRGIVSG